MIKPIIILGILVLVSCGGGGSSSGGDTPSSTAPGISISSSSNYNVSGQSFTQTYTSVQEGYVKSGGN